MSAGHSEHDRGARKTAWVLAGVAMAFYVGFILMGVLQS